MQVSAVRVVSDPVKGAFLVGRKEDALHGQFVLEKLNQR
jgi:hypothetical protein